MRLEYHPQNKEYWLTIKKPEILYLEYEEYWITIKKFAILYLEYNSESDLIVHFKGGIKFENI